MWAIAGQSGGFVGRAGGGGGGRGGRMVVVSKPAVRRLPSEELPRVLPWTGSGPRLMKEVGSLEACTARVAASLVACALVYGSSIEAASVIGFYWAWAPICATALHNFRLRLRYRYAGIWSARVIQVQIVPPQSSPRGEEGDLLGNFFTRLPYIPLTLKLIIGDGSPATFEMQLPMGVEVPEVQVGERVNLLVVSDKASLSRFKALGDVYFPDRGLWLSEDPCIERYAFEDLQEYLNAPLREPDRQGRPNGVHGTLYLEENTLSRDRGNWETAVRSGAQLGSSEEFETVMNRNDEKKLRRPIRELDVEDLYL